MTRLYVFICVYRYLCVLKCVYMCLYVRARANVLSYVTWLIDMWHDSSISLDDESCHIWMHIRPLSLARLSCTCALSCTHALSLLRARALSLAHTRSFSCAHARSLPLMPPPGHGTWFELYTYSTILRVWVTCVSEGGQGRGGGCILWYMYTCKYSVIHTSRNTFWLM